MASRLFSATHTARSRMRRQCAAFVGRPRAVTWPLSLSGPPVPVPLPPRPPPARRQMARYAHFASISAKVQRRRTRFYVCSIAHSAQLCAPKVAACLRDSVGTERWDQGAGCCTDPALVPPQGCSRSLPDKQYVSHVTTAVAVRQAPLGCGICRICSLQRDIAV